MGSRSHSVACRFFFTLGLVGILAVRGFSQGPGGTVKTWTGGGGTVVWSTAGNWNLPGVPGVNDNVVIPPDSGQIITYGPISVHELVLVSSVNADPLDNTEIIGVPKITINIGPGGGYVGIGCRLSEDPGVSGSLGGDMVLYTPNGILTNLGTISASDGANGPPGIKARDGGDVRILAANLFNSGLIRGGAGGDKQGTPGPCGASNAGNGGDVKVKLSQPGGTRGNLQGGAGGTYDNLGGPDYGRDGEGGLVSFNGSGTSVPGTTAQGSTISFHSPSTLNFQNALAGAVVADRSIRIDAFQTDLTGIASGTHVFQAPQICFRCDFILMDPGVTLQSLCGAGEVHVGTTSCASESSFELMGPVSFEDGLPQGWNAQMQQGCLNIVVGNPMVQCRGIALESTPACPGQNLGYVDTVTQRFQPSCRLEWEHVFQPAAPSGAQVFIVADGVPMPVLNVTPTPSFQFQSIDLSFLPPTTQFISARFQLQAPGTNPPTVFAIDNVAFRLPVLPLPGHPAQPGFALLDVNDARNANNLPESFGAPGPFFSYIPINTVLNLHVEGPPNQTVIFATGFILPGSIQFPGIGQLDLDPLSLLVMDPLWPLGGLGTLDLPIFIPPPLSGLTLGLQAAVTLPTSGLALTNAVEVQFGP